jgi:hypothetical protein
MQQKQKLFEELSIIMNDEKLERRVRSLLAIDDDVLRWSIREDDAPHYYDIFVYSSQSYDNDCFHHIAFMRDNGSGEPDFFCKSIPLYDFIEMYHLRRHYEKTTFPEPDPVFE